MGAQNRITELQNKYFEALKNGRVDIMVNIAERLETLEKVRITRTTTHSMVAPLLAGVK